MASDKSERCQNHISNLLELSSWRPPSNPATSKPAVQRPHLVCHSPDIAGCPVPQNEMPFLSRRSSLCYELESEGVRLLVANVRRILIIAVRDPSPRVTEVGRWVRHNAFG